MAITVNLRYTGKKGAAQGWDPAPAEKWVWGREVKL